jgi:rRNA maturation protein Nop10
MEIWMGEDKFKKERAKNKTKTNKERKQQQLLLLNKNIQRNKHCFFLGAKKNMLCKRVTWIEKRKYRINEKQGKIYTLQQWCTSLYFFHFYLQFSFSKVEK